MAVRSTRLATALSLVAGLAVPALVGGSGAAEPAPLVCPTISDPAGDAGTLTFGVVPVTGANDPDLDLRTVSLRTVTVSGVQRLLATIKVEQLSSAGPRDANGHVFDLLFRLAGKDWRFRTAKYVDPDALLADDGTSVAVGPAGGSLTVTSAPITGTFNYAASTVTFDVAVPDLATAGRVSIPAGSSMTGLQAVSHGSLLTLLGRADTAQAAVEANRRYDIGDNRCFGPPPTVLAAVGAAGAAYGDVAATKVVLKTQSGTALAGKTVTFTLGSVVRSVRTDATGVASASFTADFTGSRQLAIRFAGDSSGAASTLTRTFVVSAETTRTSAIAFNTGGTTRSVLMQLTDNDAPTRPISGQTIQWYVGSTKVHTSTTNSKGGSSWAGARAGQTVRISYAGVPGKYRASEVTKTV